MPQDIERYFTVRQLAQKYGVAVEKVLAWIHAGELRAINVASRESSRPRFRISPEAVALFEESRATQKPARALRRRHTPLARTRPVEKFF